MSEFQSLITQALGGARQVLEGNDHLAFVLLLLLVAPLRTQSRHWGDTRDLPSALRHAAIVIGLFAAGHALALLAGASGGVPVSADTVELAVALSIAVAAFNAFRPMFADGDSAMALGFGLVHGAAFAIDLAHSAGGVGDTPSLLAFVAGVALQQLALAAVVFVPLLWIAHGARHFHEAMRVGITGITALAALAWIVDRTGGDPFGRTPWLAESDILLQALPGTLWLLALAVATLRAPEHA